MRGGADLLIKSFVCKRRSTTLLWVRYFVHNSDNRTTAITGMRRCARYGRITINRRIGEAEPSVRLPYSNWLAIYNRSIDREIDCRIASPDILDLLASIVAVVIEHD